MLTSGFSGAAVRMAGMSGIRQHYFAPRLIPRDLRGIPVAELGAGWRAHVEDLATHLAGRDPDDWRTRWTALTPACEDLSRELP